MFRTALILVLLSGCAALQPKSAVNGDWLNYRVAAARAVDLTQPMHPDMAYWPGGVPFKMVRLVDYDQGYRLHKFEVGENTGTHVDAPAHFVKDAAPIDGIALKDLIAPAVVIDIKDKAAKDADYQLTPQDIFQWEKRYGRIPERTLVVLNTGWHKKFATPKDYINMDAKKVMHFPGYHPDSAPVLLERKIVGVGIDTLSLDHGASTTFGFHQALLGAGKYQIENLANLDVLPPKGATVIVGVLPVRNGTQAQARVIGLLP